MLLNASNTLTEVHVLFKKLIPVAFSDNNRSCSFLGLTVKFKWQDFEINSTTITEAMYSRLTDQKFPCFLELKLS
jgi:hypothetical protein